MTSIATAGYFNRMDHTLAIATAALAGQATR